MSTSMTAMAVAVQPARTGNDGAPSTERVDRSGSLNLHACIVQAPAALPELAMAYDCHWGGDA